MNITLKKPLGFADPLSNTGSNSLDFSESENFRVESLPFNQLGTQKQKKFSSRIDWIQGMLCITQQQFHCLQGELGSIFKDSFGDDRGEFREGKKFSHHRVSDRQAKIFWNTVLVGDDHKYDVLIWLPAKFLSGCSHLYLLRRFVVMLAEMGFKPTRLDTAIDDYTKTLTWQKIDAAYNAGHAHGFRNIDPRFPKRSGEYSGFSYPMGSSSSDKMSVLYDKFVESGGVIDAYRLESRFRDGWAISAWEHILQSARSNDIDWHKTMVNLTCVAIDFYEVINKEKVPLQWWTEWKEMVKAEGIAINSGRVTTSIESTMDWHKEGGVARTLATVEEFCIRTGSDFAEYLNDLVEYGRMKIRSIHLNQVESAMCQLEDTTSEMMRFYKERFGEYPIGHEFC